MLHKHAIVLTAIIALPILSVAQDSPVSQWSNNMLLSNPSFAGSADKIRLNIFYRNQWAKADAGFQYYGVNADMPINKNMGCGIEMENDHSSAYSRPSIYGVYSYSVQIDGKSTVSAGIKAGAIQKSLYTSDLTFEQEESIGAKSSNPKIDAGLGISAIFDKIVIAASAEHLTKPQLGIGANAETRTHIKWSIDAGYICQIKKPTQKKDIEIMPNIIFQQQGAQQNLQFCVIGQVDKLLSGISCRKDLGPDAPEIIVMIGYKSRNLRVAYSYDIETNQRTTRMGNAHELSITKLFDIKHKEKRKSIECPSFLR